MTSSDTPPTPAAGPRSPGRNLPAAIGVGVGLLGAVVVTLIWWHPGFILLLVVLTCMGAVEVHHALKRIGMNSAILPIVVGTAVIIGGSYAATVLEPISGIAWHEVLLGTLALTVLLALIWRMPGGSDGYVRDAAASLFTITYIPLLASFIGLLLASPHGAWKLVVLALCVVGSDVGGYAFGATLGKHPMAPNISPKKTWEGLVGSAVTAAVVGALGAWFLLHLPWWFGLLLGLTCMVFGTAGDLIESLIKRDVGIKDMSSSLPGHGGVMDRLDSMLVAAPAGWLLFTVFPL
ncbi:MAG: phosphatidate cytidylyltransferase [Propionicimonas sp.]